MALHTRDVDVVRIDAQQNRVAIIKAVRDLVAVKGDGVSIREIAQAAGVGTATLYRHFEGKKDLLDGVSVYRWTQMRQAAQTSPQQGAEPTAQGLRRVVGIIDMYTRMTTADAEFIHALGLRVGHDPSGIGPLRDAFDPSFAELWALGQEHGEIRRTAHPNDAIEMAGAIRESNRRLQMLTLLVAGIATPQVDPEQIVRELYLRRN
ncbi:TetR/AcrR family transcriptional regulator [Salinibacterium sp. SYSU T00001]|uniref:TetR/AcrR family transcriptional regulator n=1 Tax=Homoserinimonas sedimenticola TaxID=2986805 RepID=UPI00223553C4|nr:TetR/AcrR family transcriptional regulator [Salinibacterium sedimenticola]MCW4385647.1 TetR/AcrR family transcriptional regulator [Salinibacterium sedimenticola]